MSDTQASSGTLRRTVIRVGGGAIAASVLGGGALIYGTQPAAAATGVDTSATVELDSNQRDVTGVTLAPEIGFEWSDFSDGVSRFQLDAAVTTQAGLDEQAMNSLLPSGDSIGAGTIVTSWNNQSSKTSAVDVVSSSEFQPDGSNNDDVAEVRTGSDTAFSDASGTGTVSLTEQSLASNSFSTGLYPQNVGDGEAAGTRITVDMTLSIRDGSGSDSSSATVNFEPVEYGIIVDNPSSDASSGDTTLNSGATGE